jgi:hypothetical protein
VGRDRLTCNDRNLYLAGKHLKLKAVIFEAKGNVVALSKCSSPVCCTGGYGMDLTQSEQPIIV